MLTRAEITLIHLAKTQINISDIEYRYILKNTFNVSSSKELNKYQFKELIRIFKKLGFKNITGTITLGQYKKIKKMMYILGWDRTRINGFVKRQLGKAKAIETLDKKEANKVIEGLKKINGGE